MSAILFIKTSSLGDVIHHMPAVTEARRHYPDARIVWVAEEAFAPLAGLHPAVDQVIPVATRRWRRVLWRPAVWREMQAFRRALRAMRYDAVIDTQGLLRSAVMAKLARGTHHGYDAASVRERAAAVFYDVHHHVDRLQHAIARNRMLTAHALGYVSEGPPDFGLASLQSRVGTSKRTAVLLHATARAEKQWMLDRWQALAESLSRGGFELLLASGNEAERARSGEIAGGLPRVRMLDRQPLDTVARAIAGASVVVGIDTGLMHLAAALGLPLVAIFVGASDPRLTGPVGAGPIEVLGADRTMPEVTDVTAAIEAVLSPRF